MIFSPLLSLLVIVGFAVLLLIGGWLYDRHERREERMPDTWLRDPRRQR